LVSLTENWHLSVGYYDLWLDFDDGTSIRQRFELTEPAV
jgi:hypothetical protein